MQFYLNGAEDDRTAGFEIYGMLICVVATRRTRCLIWISSRKPLRYFFC